MNRALITLIISALLSGSATAQSSFKNADDITIREVLNSYSASSGEKVLLDPRVKARVRLYGHSLEKLSFDELSTILSIHNFNSFKSGGFLVVVPQTVMKQQPLPLVTEGQQYVDSQMVTALIEMDKLCPYDLVPILRPLTPPTSHFAPMENPRVILVTDTYGNIKRMKEVVRRLEAQLDKRQSCPELNSEK